MDTDRIMGLLVTVVLGTRMIKPVAKQFLFIVLVVRIYFHNYTIDDQRGGSCISTKHQNFMAMINYRLQYERLTQ